MSCFAERSGHDGGWGVGRAEKLYIYIVKHSGSLSLITKTLLVIWLLRILAFKERRLNPAYVIALPDS